MGYRNREIECKFQAPNTTLGMAARKVKWCIGSWNRELIGASKDVYWDAPKGVKADFIRVRYLPEGGGCLTLKFTDRKSVVDRVEIDVFVEDPDQAVEFWRHAAGKPTGEIHKKYVVYFMDKSEHTTVSIYQVTGDPRIFIETEATSKERADDLAERINRVLHIVPVPKSLFQLFFKKGAKRVQGKARRSKNGVPAARKVRAQRKR